MSPNTSTMPAVPAPCVKKPASCLGVSKKRKALPGTSSDRMRQLRAQAAAQLIFANRPDSEGLSFLQAERKRRANGSLVERAKQHRAASLAFRRVVKLVDTAPEALTELQALGTRVLLLGQ